MASNDSQHLRQLSPEKLHEFFKSFDVILSDCDGVLWLMMHPIPGALEALQSLRTQGKQVKFVSNNSLGNDKQYIEKFRKLGMQDVKENDIVHPVKTMLWHLKKHHKQSTCTVFPLIAPPSIEYLAQNGITTVSVELDLFNLDDMKIIEYLQSNGPEKVDAVLVDISLITSLLHLAKALQYLKDDNCQLILGAMDTVVPLTEKLHLPGFVDFYDILRKHSNKDPVIVGKPSPLLGEFLKEHFSITNPKRCLFIGDSLGQDMAFAKSIGFQTLLVLTGCDNKENMLKAPEEQKPDYYTESVADLTEVLQRI